MSSSTQPSLAAAVGRGVFSGLAGTAVMTAFQKGVEMPLTGRGDSYAPLNLVQRISSVRPRGRRQKKRLNDVAHFSLGVMWGSAYGIAAHRGLRGPRAVGAVFAVVYTGDVLLNTALGLYKPREWSLTDTTIDVVDKLVQAAATGALYDTVLGPPSGAAATGG